MNFQDLSGTFSAFDVAAALGLAFVLSVMIGFVYRMTHRNISYSQSYVQTLVVLGMLIALIMLVVGSNIARAFALVGARASERAYAEKRGPDPATMCIIIGGCGGFVRGGFADDGPDADPFRDPPRAP